MDYKWLIVQLGGVFINSSALPWTLFTTHLYYKLHMMICTVLCSVADTWLPMSFDLVRYTISVIVS